MSEALKPCPFCGGEAVVRNSFSENIWDHRNVEWTSISCGDCEVHFEWPTEHEEIDGEPYAVTQWNTRADLTEARLRQVAEAVREEAASIPVDQERACDEWFQATGGHTTVYEQLPVVSRRIRNIDLDAIVRKVMGGGE